MSMHYCDIEVVDKTTIEGTEYILFRIVSGGKYKVELNTKKSGSDAPAVCWRSTGEGSYELDESSRTEPGTEIKIFLKDEDETVVFFCGESHKGESACGKAQGQQEGKQLSDHNGVSPLLFSRGIRAPEIFYHIYGFLSRKY